MQHPINRRAALLGLAGGAATAGLAAPAIAKGRTTLRFQTIDPPSFIGPSVVLPKFQKTVDSLSGGDMKVEIFTAGQVIPTAEIPSGLAAGVIDLAYTASVYYTGSVKENLLSYTAMPPMTIPQVDDGYEVYLNRGVDDIIATAYRKEGVEYLGSVFVDDPITFWSREKLDGAQDLSGFKVRSFGYAAKTLEKLGAAPVFIPHEEVYTALSQGSIDGSMTVASYYMRAKYFEVAPYLYMTDWYSFTQMCAMASSGLWQRLSDEQRAILHYAVRQMSSDMRHATWLGYRQMLPQLEGLGCTLVDWSAEDAATIKTTAAGFLPEIREAGPEVARGLDLIESHVASLYGKA